VATQRVGSAFVDIRADTTRFESDLKSSLDNSVKTASGQVKKFGSATNESLMVVSKRMSDVGKDLSKKVTLPLVALGTGALITAGNFEAGMNKVRAITGGTEADIKQLSDQAKELGSSTKFSATEAANAMSFLGMAGFDTNQILGAMPGTLQLAAAANMGLAEAADITSNVLSGFGIEVDQLGSVNDALVKTLTRTNTDLSQLGQAFKFVGPVAKGAGIEFNEVAAAIGLLGNAGIQAGMAGTSLRGAITALLNPSKQVSGIMQSLGLNVKDANGELLPLNEIIEQLEVSGASTGEMMQIFGQRAGPAMMALVEQGSEALRGLTEELDNSGGTAENIANIQMEGLNGAMTELKSAVEGFMIALGESGLLKAMTGFTKFLSTTVRALGNMNPVFLTTVTIVGAFAAALGPLLIVSGSLIRNFVLMRQTLINLRSSKIAATIAAHGLRAAMIAIPLVAVAAGALAIFSAFKKSGDEAKAMADKVDALKSKLEGGATATEVAREKLEEMIRKSPAFGQAMLDAGVNINTFAEMAEHDFEAFSETVNRVAQAAGANITEFTKHGVIKNGKEIKKTVDEITTDLMAIPEATRQVQESAVLLDEVANISMDSVGEGFQKLTDWSVESLQKIRDEMEATALGSDDAMSVLAQASEYAAKIVEDELGKVEKAAEDLAKSVEQSTRSAADSFLKLSNDGKRDMNAFVNEMIEGAARLTVFQDNLITIASATSGEFATFLMSMGTDVEQMVSDMADPRKRALLEDQFNAWALSAQTGARDMGDEFAKVDPAFKKTLSGVAGLTDTEMENIRVIAERKAVEVGTALMLGQVEGITKNSAAVQEAVTFAVNEAIVAAMRAAGIQSPSRRMAEEVGKPMAQGVAVGIEEASDEIDAAMRRTIQEAMIKAAEELDQNIRNISDRASGSFLRDVIPSSDEIMAIEDIVDEVTGEIIKMGRNARSASDVFVENLINSSKRLSGFQDNILSITEMTSGEFGLYLLEMGLEAEELVRDLSDPAKLHVLDQAYKAWVDSTAVAQRDMSSEFAKVDPAFAEILQGLNITLEDEMKPVIATASRTGGSAGSSLVSSTAAGIAAQLPGLQAQIDRYNAILAQRQEPPPPVMQGGPGGLGIEGEAGLYGQSLVTIQNASFSSGTDAQAVAQQIRASLGAMIAV
jgi:TP901 family phage tail tape measure protein